MSLICKESINIFYCQRSWRLAASRARSAFADKSAEAVGGADAAHHQQAWGQCKRVGEGDCG
eukprot:3046205-Pleurochrysis_carterae.AAC.3